MHVNNASVMYIYISIRKQSAYHLRSNDGILLDLPCVEMLRSFGDKSFAGTAPAPWNALPLAIRKSRSLQHFKSSPRTYLFKLAMP